MNEATRRYTRNFYEDYETARKLCRWDGDKLTVTMAATLIGNDFPTTMDRFKRAEDTIKKNSGMFSEFRSGYARKIIHAVIATADDQSQAFNDIKKILSLLKPGLLASYTYPIAASLIWLTNEDGHYETATTKTLEIFGEVKNNHKIIGGDKDLLNCTLLASTGRDPQSVADEYEECYSELTKFFGKGSDTLFAAAAMALFQGDPTVKAQKIKELHINLKAKRFHFTSAGLEMIAFMAGLFDSNMEEIINEMREVSAELSKAKGLGSWGVGDKNRNMLSAAIVIAANTEDPKITLFAKQVILNILCRQIQDDDASTTTMLATM